MAEEETPPVEGQASEATIIVEGQVYLFDRALTESEVMNLYCDHNGLFTIKRWVPDRSGVHPELVVNAEHPLADGLVAAYIPYEGDGVERSGIQWRKVTKENQVNGGVTNGSNPTTR